jgi:hypothetical protein
MVKLYYLQHIFICNEKRRLIVYIFNHTTIVYTIVTFKLWSSLRLNDSFPITLNNFKSKYLNLRTYQFKILVGTKYHDSLLFQIEVHVPRLL